MIENNGIMELEGMEFHSFHGVLEREKVVGNLFVVDFRGEMDMRLAAESDSLHNALDYSRIYETIAAEMSRSSDLLENVAGRIVKVIAMEFPQLKRFSVRVSKQRPPVSGVMKWSRITLSYSSDSEESVL